MNWDLTVLAMDGSTLEDVSPPRGLGFWGFGCRVWDLGFWGLGLRSLGFLGLGFRV